MIYDCLVSTVIVITDVMCYIVVDTDESLRNETVKLISASVLLLVVFCQMRLIKCWIWLLPVILVTTVMINVYLLSYLHSTKCEYSVCSWSHKTSLLCFCCVSQVTFYHSNILYIVF